jgi:acyl-CoA synthetase (AMP-forming)/AMP-acid ligase II
LQSAEKFDTFIAAFARGNVPRVEEPMNTPLTPLEFARRARRLFGAREAVVDGDLRLTYEQFFDRCDRWSAVLQRLGVKRGDRVAYIAPNIHAQLESFYAVPQIGAILVPINYRLAADDFAYILTHSGANVVCVASECLAAVDGIRAQLPSVAHFVALEDIRDGWLEYEREIAAAAPAGVPPTFERPAIAEDDVLTINYTSGTTARPKGVMITHRNAWFTQSAFSSMCQCDPRTAISGRWRCFTPTAGRLRGR